MAMLQSPFLITQNECLELQQMQAEEKTTEIENEKFKITERYIHGTEIHQTPGGNPVQRRTGGAESL
ncbi:MAG: hypothetical protein HFH84_04650 [Lachnospiraceae bacterium]|nr:hypothetical protein [Lachnospiraceae bacterium]